MLYHNLEGWDVIGVGGQIRGRGYIYIYLWLNHIVVLQKPTQSYKGIILHLKNKDLKK